MRAVGLVVILSLSLAMISSPGVSKGSWGCTSTYVSHDTHLHDSGRNGGEAYQDWHASFGKSGKKGCSGGTNPDYIDISANGNSDRVSNPGDYYTVSTSDYSWIRPGTDVTVYYEANYATSSSVTRTMPNVNRPPNQPSNPDPSDGGTVGNGHPTISVAVSDPDNDNMDVTFYQGDSTGAGDIGEAGITTNMNDNNWYSDSFSYPFSSTPLVFATTQTTNGGQDPSAAHLKNVNTNGFDVQHCEYDGGNSCDSHASEDTGWAAFDPDKISSIDGMDAGTFQTNSGSGGYSVSFDSSISNTPYIFTQSQTSDGAPTRNTQAHNVDSNGATVEFCEQDSTDGCEGHTSERVAWIAIDPTRINDQDGLDYGDFHKGNSNWQSVSFDQNMNNPIVIADVQTEDGGQEALYPEVDHVDNNGADVRYCESEHNDNCDSHNSETVAWLAIDRGTISISEATGGGETIGTDYSVSSGSRASVEFNDATCGESNSWYAIASDGSESTASNSFTFDANCNDPPSISGLSFSNQNGHTFSTSADVSDPDGNIDRCEFRAASADGSNTYTDSNPGSTCSITGINYQDVSADHLENVDVTATVYDTFGESDSTSGTKSFPNHAPTTGSIQFTDYIAEHAFNVTVPVDDQDDGSSELENCNWSFESGSDTYTETTSPEAGECHYGNFSDAKEGFEVGDSIDVSLEATDTHGAAATVSGTTTIENREPVYSEPVPPNMSVVADEKLEISALVNDVDDEEMNVYFFRSSNDELIGKDTARSGRRASTNWPNLQVGKVYDWYIKVSDGYTNVSNKADDWNFTKTLSGDYRLRTDIEHRYTSIVTSVDSTKFITFGMQSPIASNKTVDVELSGVNAEFNDGSTTKTVELGPYESEKLQVRVQPQVNGTHELRITATERGTGIQSTNTIDVLVEKLKTSTSRAEEVPGPGLIQLLVLSMIAATVTVFRIN